MAQGSTTVSVTTIAEGFTSQIRTERPTGAGSHVVVSDEPTDVNGDDKGPTPVELFLGSLAACKTMTARMYAARKDWPLREIGCRVTLSRRTPEGEDQARDHLDVELTLNGDLDEEQRQRIAEITGNCPVHKLIEGDTRISTTLAK